MTSRSRRLAAIAVSATLLVGACATGSSGGADAPTSQSSSSGEAAATTYDVTRTHVGETEFVGVVTGHANPEGEYGFGCDKTKCVAVDNAAVNLALIETWEISCFEPNELDEELALAEKVRLLPVGTVVRVVRSLDPDDSSFNYVGFIHLVDEATATPHVESTNEILVASGYWVPDYTWSNSSLIGNPYAELSTFDYAANHLLTDVEAEYAPHLLEAASASRVERVGGQADCDQQIIDRAAYEAEIRESYEESKRKADLWYANWLLTHPGGLVGCRDGDGDGVCFER